MPKKNKNNWDKIRNQTTADSARTRDVYEDQQLDRSRIEKPQTMTSRTILAAVAAVAVALFMWWLVAQIETTGALDGVNRGWNRTFYSKDGVGSPYQYVTIRDGTPVFENDGTTPVIDEETGEQKMSYSYVKYIWFQETGILTDITHGKLPVYTDCDEAWYNSDGDLKYGPKKDDQDDAYKEQRAARDQAVADMIEKPKITVKLNLSGDSLADDPGLLGRVEGYGYVFPKEMVSYELDWGDAREGGSEDMYYVDMTDPVVMSGYGFEMRANPYQWVRLNRGKLVDTAGKMNHERFLDMRPTPVKLFLSILFAGAVFGIMYMVMKKNLAAQNVLTDTSDINQHHNDQHIALPEEVQSLYDIFPDVGCHSSVMVSSMISHQMITNKGLKKVRLAKRAEKDILDEDGDVEVYKGDILRDEHGEPITTEVPIIDPKFSEALFDCAKVPADKAVRKYYDATQIPYNPGDTNLDKLKGFNTVAELINSDWEFPVYEPQRPGGVYIVDTAPVNTMVLAITRAG